MESQIDVGCWVMYSCSSSVFRKLLLEVVVLEQFDLFLGGFICDVYFRMYLFINCYLEYRCFWMQVFFIIIVRIGYLFIYVIFFNDFISFGYFFVGEEVCLDFVFYIIIQLVDVVRVFFVVIGMFFYRFWMLFFDSLFF